MYVHIDMDVLKANVFPFSAWPSEDGIAMETLETILKNVTDKFHIVGASLVEFIPFDTNGMAQLLQIVKKLSSAITKVT